MKKYFLILLTILFSYSVNAQIEVTSDNTYGKIDEFEKGSYEKLLKTTTVFVFSNVYEKSFYEEILNESWTLTPFEIVAYKDFDPTKYFSDEYSFCVLKAKKDESVFFSYLHLYMYNMKNINKIFSKTKWEKLDERQTIGKKFTVSMQNQINFGKIYFYAKAELFKNLPPFSGMEYGRTKKLGYNAMQMKSNTYVVPNGSYLVYGYGYSKQDEKVEHLGTMHQKFYTEKVHYNYEKGILTNYLTALNDRVKNKEYCTRYELEPSSELKNLKTNTLYIPEYVKIKYDGWKIEDKPMSSSEVSKMMSGYKYKYEFISAEKLNKRIEDKEEFYYLNYSRLVATQLLQVVNAKTGKAIYKTKAGFDMKYNISPKHFEKLSKIIAKK